MPAVADLALGLAPIAGGVILGAAAGYLKGPDVRKGIRQDMDLLDRLPSEDVERRAALQRSIDTRVDDLVATVHRYRPLRRAAATYRGGLRDILLFISMILFTGVWWSVDHDKNSWLPMFVVLIVISIWAAAYASSGLLRAVLGFRHRND
ncbi:YtxH domain-containing protein [Nocardia sp. BMG111209]|uniref:YtxH domain-containing protein n=1 Tax=Nocardia sp. BMG111209 TaxID=1160137 RepID=UPI000477B3E0|nr:YtxH domain-containing protein [Nocardia sp. BMG111209]